MKAIRILEALNKAIEVMQHYDPDWTPPVGIAKQDINEALDELKRLQAAMPGLQPDVPPDPFERASSLPARHPPPRDLDTGSTPYPTPVAGSSPIHSLNWCKQCVVLHRVGTPHTRDDPESGSPTGS